MAKCRGLTNQLIITCTPSTGLWLATYSNSIIIIIIIVITTLIIISLGRIHEFKKIIVVIIFIAACTTHCMSVTVS